MATSPEPKRLAARLLDLSFNHLVTARVAPLLYSLAVAVAALLALLVLATGLTSGSGLQGAGSLVFAPVLFLVIVLGARIGVETAVVVSRIGDNAAYIARRVAPEE